MFRNNMKKYIVALIGAFFSMSLVADTLPDLHRPLDIPAVLSGNFGELRSNHFHSGIDFKTQGRTGFDIHSAEDGYVSRVTVSPWGFGRAVYIVHPSIGLTTVYGHLESFATKIDTIIKNEQYRIEQFSVDMTFEPNEIPVNRGEIIAKSGNSGSSGGPHLHMDVRETATGDALDPMPYFKSLLADNIAPQFSGLALYPQFGVVDGDVIAAYRTTSDYNIPFKAWGKVVPAIRANDKMTGTTNVYGVKYLTLFVDGRKVYERTIDRVDFNETRAINTIVDYRDRVKKNRWYMTTRIPANNRLDYIIKTDSCYGVLDINEERDYKCRYELSDEHGNKKTIHFVIKGEYSEIPDKEYEGVLFHFDIDNTYRDSLITVTLPQYSLYDNMFFNVVADSSSKFYSPIFSVGDVGVPLHHSFEMRVSLNKDTIGDKGKYCLVRLNGNKKSAMSSRYENGTIVAKSNRFGRYAVTVDTIAPKVTLVNPVKWGTSGRIRVKIADNLSGIENYRGEVDGKFVLLEYDGKNAMLSYRLDKTRVKRGIMHTFEIVVTDACGNITRQTHRFKW